MFSQFLNRIMSRKVARTYSHYDTVTLHTFFMDVCMYVIYFERFFPTEVRKKLKRMFYLARGWKNIAKLVREWSQVVTKLSETVRSSFPSGENVSERKSLRKLEHRSRPSYASFSGVQRRTRSPTPSVYVTLRIILSDMLCSAGRINCIHAF